MNFFAGKNMQSSIKRQLLITKNRHLKLTILVFFYLREDIRSGVTEILPEVCV